MSRVFAVPIALVLIFIDSSITSSNIAFLHAEFLYSRLDVIGYRPILKPATAPLRCTGYERTKFYR